jgi:hypothetical protein
MKIFEQSKRPIETTGTGKCATMFLPRDSVLLAALCSIIIGYTQKGVGATPMT